MTLHDLTGAYRSAEEAISRAEEETKSVPIPALNEMRYAGSHALAYMQAKDDSRRAEELDSAVKHCRRAYFDAERFILLKLYADVRDIRRGLAGYLHFFAEVYGAEPYLKLKKGILAVRECINELHLLKENNGRWAKREEFAEKCTPYIKACRDYILAYEAVEEELCNRVDEAKKEQESRESSQRIGKWTLYVGLLTLIAGIIAIIVSVIVS